MGWNLLVLTALASLGVFGFVLLAWVENLLGGAALTWQPLLVLVLFCGGVWLFAHGMALRRRGLHRRAALVLGILAVVMLPYGLALAGAVYVFVFSGARF